MIELDVVKDIIKHRADIFKQYLELKTSRLDSEKLFDECKTTMDILINRPSFKLSSDDAPIKQEVTIYDKGFHVPFDAFSVIVESGKTTVVYAVTKVDKDCLKVSALMRNTSWFIAGAPFLFRILNGDTPEVTILYGVQQSDEILLETGDIFSQCLAFLLASTNSVAYCAARTEQTTLAKAAQNKKFEYRYVLTKLSDIRPKSEPKGGTHASPAWHERRGFFRTCASGKRVWVRAAEVGKKSNGIVEKDYVAGST